MSEIDPPRRISPAALGAAAAIVALVALPAAAWLRFRIGQGEIDAQTRARLSPRR